MVYESKVGLPNSCAKCGKSLHQEWWIENEEQAKAGQGLCTVCANNSEPASGVRDLATVTGALGKRLADLLLRNGYETVEQVANASDEELLLLDGIGPATLRKIRDVLHV